MGASRKVCDRVERKYDHDVYICGGTFLAARLALGSTIEATKEALKTKSHAVCAVRPPGHHACHRRAMGFCFLNSVAAAAKLAVEGQLSENKERVLVVDWDIHHGNGTQDMLWRDRQALYFSVHRGLESKKHFGSRRFYPGTGHPRDVGQGYTVNCSWSEPGMGDAEYAACWLRLLLPIAEKFRPTLVIVSAGFDAARGDPLGECLVSPEGYFRMTEALATKLDAPIVLVLEGGYNLDVIGPAFACSCSALLGDLRPPTTNTEIPSLEDLASDCLPVAADDINDTRRAHASYWDLDIDPLVCQMTGISLEPRTPPGGGAVETPETTVVVETPETVVCTPAAFKHDPSSVVATPSSSSQLSTASSPTSTFSGGAAGPPKDTTIAEDYL